MTSISELPQTFRPTFADNPAYVEYETLLKRLHVLIAESKGDDDIADEVRDEMERPYRRLNGYERDRLSGLSGDLYMLSGEEIFEPLPDEIGTRAILTQRILEAAQRSQSEEILRLLRFEPDYSSDVLAYRRALAYRELDHKDTALLFLDYALSLKPSSARYQAERLYLLNNLGRQEEAVEQAVLCISNPLMGASDLADAAYTLFFATYQTADQWRIVKLSNLVINALERVLDGSAPDPQYPEYLLRSYAFVVVGYAYEGIGDKVHARHAYTRSINADASNRLAKEALEALDHEQYAYRRRAIDASILSANHFATALASNAKTATAAR